MILVTTGRARVYQHVLEGGHEPPIDLAKESTVQMHGAPAEAEDAPGEYRLSSIQATASLRYWKYVPDLHRALWPMFSDLGRRPRGGHLSHGVESLQPPMIGHAPTVSPAAWSSSRKKITT